MNSVTLVFMNKSTCFPSLFPFLQYFHKNRREGREDAQGNQYPANGSAEQDADIVTGQGEAAAKTPFSYRTQNQRKHYRCGVQIQLPHQITEEAEQEHDTHFHKTVVDSKGPYHAQHEYAWDQNGIGQTGDMREQTAAAQTDQQHEELGNYETCKECVCHFRVLGKQLRTGLQTLNNQTAHQYGCYRFSGDAQGQSGDQ